MGVHHASATAAMAASLTAHWSAKKAASVTEAWKNASAEWNVWELSWINPPMQRGNPALEAVRLSRYQWMASQCDSRKASHCSVQPPQVELVGSTQNLAAMSVRQVAAFIYEHTHWAETTR